MQSYEATNHEVIKLRVLQPWEEDRDGEGGGEGGEGDSGSSDGRGSSYFSGERRDDTKSGSASPLLSASGSRELWGGSHSEARTRATAAP
jgi:hypothetical protein